jgi:nucleoside-diphosphate-sugar epimerase
MKTAIIGGSGFIGTRLTKRLIEAKHKVKIIDKRKSDFYPELWEFADVRDCDSLVKTLKGCDVIYNLAAEHKDNVIPVSLYDEVNVNGARNMCKAAENLGIKKIIFTSSVAVYGFAPNNTDETGQFNPFNDYGRTKMLAEGVYRGWLAKDTSRSLTIIRPTVVFGERNRGNVYNLLKQMASGKFLMVGHGNNQKSMAYVENVSSFLEYSLKFKKGEHLFNYIDKPDLTMNDLVSTVNNILGRKPKLNIRLPYLLGYMGGLTFDVISKITGKEFPVSAIRIKKFCKDTQFASANIAASGFTPPVILSEGIKRTVKFEFIDREAEKGNSIVFETE